MKHLLFPFARVVAPIVAGVLAISVVSYAAPAWAGACDRKASSVAAQYGGRVLSASSSGNKCRITILIPQANKAPRRKTVVVSK